MISFLWIERDHNAALASLRTLFMSENYEPRYEKTGFLHMRKTKTQISFEVTAKLIWAFVFATRSTIPLLPIYEISSL